MEEEEAIAALGPGLAVERLDALHRGLDQRGVLRQVLRLGVVDIAQEGEVEVGVEVAQRRHLELLELRLHALDGW